MSTPPPDPLVSLWQSAPQPDPQNLLHDLRRLNRLHRQHNRNILAIVCGVAALLVFEEATGRLGSRGVLSAVWIVCIVGGGLWQRRARCSRLHALTQDTARLLKAMIARARNDLFVARCLYAGVPLGAAAGYLVSNLLAIGASKSASVAHPQLVRVQTGAGLTMLFVMVAMGVILAHSRSRQVRDLTDKFRAMESDL